MATITHIVGSPGAGKSTLARAHAIAEGSYLELSRGTQLLSDPFLNLLDDNGRPVSTVIVDEDDGEVIGLLRDMFSEEYLEQNVKGDYPFHIPTPDLIICSQSETVEFQVGTGEVMVASAYKAW